MSAPNTLTRDAKIADLFLMGNPIDTIATAGRERGWNRADCLRVAAENGWTLDATGRLPRSERKPTLAPAPTPRPSPAPLAALPPRTDAAPDPADRLIADGKAHTVARVRKLADKAEAALADLRRALRDESGKEEIRRRLAELDAERDRLRAQLGGPGRPPKPHTEGGDQPKPVKPINHGGYGGYQAHKKRGEDPCADCERGKDEHMAAMRSNIGKVTA